MARKNRNTRHRQAPRRADGLPATKPGRRTPRVPIEQMVVPVGKCYFRSRHGKLRFTEAEIEKVLRQVRLDRESKGIAHAEQRYYPCPEGGCGDFHLTSRTEYTPRSTS